MRPHSRYPDRSCSSPCESDSDSSGVGIPISSPYDPFTNYLTLRPKFLRYDPERRREILRRLEEAMDVFRGTSIGSNSEGSVSEDSAKQEQEDSDSDGAGNGVEKPRICSLRWLFELLLLLLILMLFMACICNTSISSLPHNFEDWHKRSICTYEGVSEKNVDFDGSNKSISCPSDEVGDTGGMHGNLSFTHEEPPEKIVELFESERDATQTEVDSSSGDVGNSAEWIVVDEVMQGLLRENYQYDQLDETGEVRDGGIWKRVEVESEESSKAAETRVEKNDDVCEQVNGCEACNSHWIKKNSEPRANGIAELEVGSEIENLLLQESREVDEVTSAPIGNESVTSAVLYGSTTAVLAFVLVLLSRRKKKLGNDSSPTTGHSFGVPPIKCPRELAEKPGSEDHFASNPVSSFPLEGSPSLGSFTAAEMTSTKREDGNGEAWISAATPVRRSSRIRDRATRSRRHLRNEAIPVAFLVGSLKKNCNRVI